MRELIPVERIESKIYLIRGKKVLLDRDLADLYGVETKQLKRAIKRNITRFPDDFMFKLNKEEQSALRCHIGTLKRGTHSKYLSYAFTELGVAMLSSVLNSEKAIRINIQIMRAFVKLRQIISNNKELAAKLDELEKQVNSNTAEIRVVFDAIRLLLTKPEKKMDEKPKRKIGFLGN